MKESVRLEVVSKIKEMINSDKTLLKDRESLYKLIIHEFKTILNKNNNDYLCEHEVWLYNGYISSTNERRYKCLECTKTIKTKAWQVFEEENCVLKKYSPERIDQYIKLYYLLLFKHQTSDAQKQVITEFYRINNEKMIHNQRKRK